MGDASRSLGGWLEELTFETGPTAAMAPADTRCQLAGPTPPHHPNVLFVREHICNAIVEA